MAPPWIRQQQREQKSPNAPPADVHPGELVARLQQMPRPNKRDLPFPRNDDDGQPIGKFALWVLMQHEVDLCRSDAERYATALMERPNKEKPNQFAWNENYQSALFVEVLYRSLRENDDLSKPLFRSPDEIRHHLSDDECVHLYEAYSAFQQTHGPLFRVLTGDEVDEWIEVLAEGADHYPFELCSRGQLVALVVSLASQIRTSRTGGSSSGTPSTDGATDTPSTSGKVVEE
ncbi:MAG: hypothetical protein M0R22_11180 [Dehalococcoidia bacterium]|jgi:hypothetical protein|nr:hypothetical protein [Dehalococcoidia bacterium]